MNSKKLRENFIVLCENILSTPSNFNITITGRNMSGKSDILIYLLKKMSKLYNSSDVYFIDTVNRSLNTDNSVGMPSPSLIETVGSMGSNIDILQRRIIPIYLNKVDTYSTGEHHLGAFYTYHYLKSRLNEKLFKKEINRFINEFNLTISINNESNKIEIFKNGYSVKPSSGLQAIIRLFVEFTHAYSQGAKYIVVDEIDSHLDAFMCSKILNKLIKQFPMIKIISTVHSLNYFEEINYNKIYIIKDDLLNFDIVDSRDITSLDYINREIFNNKDLSIDIEKTLVEKIFIKVMNQIQLTDKELFIVANNSENSPKDQILIDSIKDSLNID